MVKKSGVTTRQVTSQVTEQDSAETQARSNNEFIRHVCFYYQKSFHQVNEVQLADYHTKTNCDDTRLTRIVGMYAMRAVEFF